ncbi:MAG: Holliday junction resolvase RuvX [Halanaerobiales bacterium]
MRVLGLDYGARTIGVAVSDLMGWTAQGLEVIRRKNEYDLKETMERLKELIDQFNVEKIIVGLPKNMNNTLGERAEKTLIFVNKLETTFELPVVTWDERLSTMFAERTLIEADVSRNKRKKVIDKMAAVFILQGFLDSINK